MGSQNHIKTRNIETVGGLWTLQIFNEFLVGTVVLWEAVEMHGDQWNTAMREPPMWPADFVKIRSRRLVWRNHDTVWVSIHVPA